MPRGTQNLASMSIEALISLRDKVVRALNDKTNQLRKQLQQLEAGGWSSSSGRQTTKGERRTGGKIPPKYRDTDNRANTWAGRGAIPRWMAEKLRSGAKREDFLIGSPAASTRKKRAAKQGSKRSKAKSVARSTKRAKRAAAAKPKRVRVIRERRRQSVAMPAGGVAGDPGSDSK